MSTSPTGLSSSKDVSLNASISSPAWYISAMEHLVHVVQMLSQAHEMNELSEIIRHAARELTGADGATFVLRDGNQCFYAEENAISPLWKGKRFPLHACISGWVMLNREAAVIEDIYCDPRIPQDAYRPTFVKSLVMVPIRRNSPIGAIGNYWALKRKPSVEEVRILQALADTASVALENVKLYTHLKTSMEIIKKREARIRTQHSTLEIFTRALAHDLKEPVRTINSFTDIIKEESKLTGKTREYFQLISNASHRMLTLINTVFLYIQLDSKSETPKENCDMNQIVHEVIENLDNLIKEREAQIIFSKLPLVKANHVHMTQLMQNLISNAISHNDSEPKIEIFAKKQSHYWLFQVSDNGIGIDKKEVDKIFLPFKRNNQNSKGIGLGLSICEKIIEAHNGKIWCSSEPGQGSTFFFTLPALAKIKPQSKKNAITSKVYKASRDPLLATILLVDDLPADLELTQLILKRAKISCNLLFAQSGKEALDIIRKIREKHEQIDLVLLDINMPGMDGFEAFAQMQLDDALKDIAVVMCSGSTYEKDKERAKAMGAAGYVLKPIEKESLEQVIAGIPKLRFSATEDGYRIYRLRK
ncbi:MULTISPECIES: ATP-binding protein [Legionella]|uniref:ATP-binding protein n=1 Tax=Legionella TaxID=445 RepID=UPI000F8CEE86|nr:MULTISPECIES: ATP-binding protein [Legionella]MCP0913877.1 ATP-binding protein [Legionella sp. 27cVA30]RUQ98720.1 hybrid sensor histidine kinase/response regulator [Legionella septentrionalis]RUR09907.1 hybrid sensor histidine kinase/response regulator [Legionella septentrionalis]RUR15013.1 hybrid sensor histidine kinase/response regulator [Legionella septentrionalis]